MHRPLADVLLRMSLCGRRCMSVHLASIWRISDPQHQIASLPLMHCWLRTRDQRIDQLRDTVKRRRLLNQFNFFTISNTDENCISQLFRRVSSQQRTLEFFPLHGNDISVFFFIRRPRYEDADAVDSEFLNNQNLSCLRSDNVETGNSLCHRNLSCLMFATLHTSQSKMECLFEAASTSIPNRLYSSASLCGFDWLETATCWQFFFAIVH